MKKLLTLFLAIGWAVISNAQNYSTEATIIPHKDKGNYEVVAVIAQLIDQNGKQTEKVISRPRLLTSPGVPASIYVGPATNQADYKTADNINVDVSWPKSGENGIAFYSVVIKRGDKIIFRSKLQLHVNDN